MKTTATVFNPKLQQAIAELDEMIDQVPAHYPDHLLQHQLRHIRALVVTGAIDDDVNQFVEKVTRSN